MKTIRLFALGALLSLPACGGLAASHAADVAATQHGCPNERVRVIGDAGNWTYWLDVCGTRRLYSTRGGNYREIVGAARAPVYRQPMPAPVYAQPADPEASVAVQVDEFTGHRRVLFETPLEWEGVVRQSRSTTLAISVIDGHLTGFNITASFSDWRWLRCHHTVALLDGEPVDLEEAEHNGTPSTAGYNAYVIEHVSVIAADGILDRLLNASLLRIRVCGDVLRVPASSIDELRQVPILAAEIRAAVAPPSEPAEGEPVVE